MKILDPEFNRVVLEMSKQVQYYVTDHEYKDFDDMKTSYLRDGYLLINRGNSENIIFGVPYVNHAFRAWHDYCHVRNNADFSVDGERLAFEQMVYDVIYKYGSTEQTHWFARILDCEVNGQTGYFMKHNKFPDNQYEFAIGYLGLEG